MTEQTELMRIKPLTGQSQSCFREYRKIYFCYVAPRAMMETAKIFWSGRSQAVRLPKDFRVEGKEVRIRRHGAAVILEPIPLDWAWLDALGGPVDADFEQAATEEPTPQERQELNTAFGG